VTNTLPLDLLTGTLAALLKTVGRIEYRLVIQDAQLVEIARLDMSPSPGKDESPYISMNQAEKILHHAPGWLSRRKDGRPMWEFLGLNPRRSGRNLLFKRADLYAHLENQVARKRGRPRTATNAQ
jgi:hypothetical protein